VTPNILVRPDLVVYTSNSPDGDPLHAGMSLKNDVDKKYLESCSDYTELVALLSKHGAYASSSIPREEVIASGVQAYIDTTTKSIQDAVNEAVHGNNNSVPLPTSLLRSALTGMAYNTPSPFDFNSETKALNSNAQESARDAFETSFQRSLILSENSDSSHENGLNDDSISAIDDKKAENIIPPSEDVKKSEKFISRLDAFAAASKSLEVIGVTQSTPTNGSKRSMSIFSSSSGAANLASTSSSMNNQQMAMTKAQPIATSIELAALMAIANNYPQVSLKLNIK
jgi:hypothetical protein